MKLRENHEYTYNIMSVHKAKPKLTRTKIKSSKNIFMNISETKSSGDYTRTYRKELFRIVLVKTYLFSCIPIITVDILVDFYRQDLIITKNIWINGWLITKSNIYKQYLLVIINRNIIIGSNRYSPSINTEDCFL